MSAPALDFDGLEETPALRLGHKGRARCRFGLMLVLSILGHAATFYVFQVAYTPSGSLLPPPARVVLVPLDRPENASFARWLSLADPTLNIQPGNPVASVPDLPEIRYLPSYEAMPPAFKPLESGTPAESIAAPPRPFVPGPVAMTDAPPDKAPTTTGTGGTPAVEPAHLVLSGNLMERIFLPIPPLSFLVEATSTPQESSVFLVGVRTGGGEPFVFPVRQAPANNVGIGAEEVDEFARSYLARLTFRPAAAPNESVAWGKATFYWGSAPFSTPPRTP